MKILLSGFNPFGDLSVNSSEVVVAEIRNRWPGNGEVDLTAEILRTEYRDAEDRIRTLIRELRPDGILCLGVADRDGTIRLERLAVNLDDESMPDNAGEVRREQQIADGPHSYRSTLPLRDMRKALVKLGVPVRFSTSAGNYVCNHVFYSALHEVDRLGLDAKCGFVHLPSIQTRDSSDVMPDLPAGVLNSAVTTCLDVIRVSCSEAS
jgi:pyroglutamyl-peptidase